MSKSGTQGRRGGDITVRVVRREQPDIAALRRALLATAIARLSSPVSDAEVPSQSGRRS
jgi:hypothetical protein